MSKDKRYSYKSNPFRWQLQEQYRNLLKACGNVTEERLEQVMVFILSEIGRVNNSDFVQSTLAEIRQITLFRLHDFIREDVLSFEKFSKDERRKAEYAARMREVEEEVEEEDYSGMTGWERDYMEGFYGDEQLDDSREEGISEVDIAARPPISQYKPGAEGEMQKWISDVADTYRPRKWKWEEEGESYGEWLEDAVHTSHEAERYREWAKNKLSDLRDINDPQELLNELFDDHEGYSWFLHEELMGTLFFGDELLDHFDFTRNNPNNATRDEAELIFAVIDLYIDWEKADINSPSFILDVLTKTFVGLQEDFAGGAGPLVDAQERFIDRVLFYNDEDVLPELQEIESKYNQAIQRGDLIRAQKYWSIHSTYRRFLHKKQLLDEDGESVVSYEESVNSVSRVNAAKHLKNALDRAEKYYPMRFYPHQDTSKLSYTDEGGEVTTFDALPRLMGELESFGKSIEQYRDKDSRNVLVPAFVFVVSHVNKRSGGVTREFVEVKLDLQTENKVLSKNPQDKVIPEGFDLTAQAKIDIVNGHKVFATRSEGENAIKSMGAAPSALYHSERVLIQALRDPDSIQRIVELLRIEIRKQFDGLYVDFFTIDSLVLVAYSTNSVCKNCSPSLIYLQNSKEEGGPMNLLVQELNLSREGEIKLSTRGYNSDSGQQDYSQLKMHTVVTASKNFVPQAHDLTDYHHPKAQVKKPNADHNPKAKIILPDHAIDLSMSAWLPDGSYELGKPYIVEFTGIDHTASSAGEAIGLNCFEGVCFTSGEERWGLDVPEGKFAHNRWYTEDQMTNILEQHLPSEYGYTVMPQTQFEHVDALRHNLGAAIADAYNGNEVAMPIHLHGNHWAGAVIRRQADERLQVIYVDPMGNQLQNETNAVIFVQTLNELAPTANIVDIGTVPGFRQQQNGYDCGPFTVDNLINLIRTDINTDNLTAQEVLNMGLINIPVDGNATEQRARFSPYINGGYTIAPEALNETTEDAVETDNVAALEVVVTPAALPPLAGAGFPEWAVGLDL